MPTIGTCSKCNGPVQVPDLWGGTVPPVPTCAHCGATAKDPYGPIMVTMRPIPMEKRPPSRAGAQQPAAGTHAEFVKWFNSCGVQDRPPSQLARAAWDAALSSQQPAAVDGEVGCRCIDCGGNQPGHDPTCSYMHELHGGQTAAVDGGMVERIAALLHEEATAEPWTVAGVEHPGPDRGYYRGLARKVAALAAQHQEESK